jgi:hypothetical protein
MVEEDLALLAELPGWTVTGPVAEYRISDVSWAARIRRVTVFGKAHHAWFVSVIDPTGVARYTVSAQLRGYARPGRRRPGSDAQFLASSSEHYVRDQRADEEQEDHQHRRVERDAHLRALALAGLSPTRSVGGCG